MGRSSSRTRSISVSKPDLTSDFTDDDDSADLLTAGCRWCCHPTSHCSVSSGVGHSKTGGGVRGTLRYGRPPTSLKSFPGRKKMSSALKPSPDGDKSIGYRLEAESITTFLAAAIAVALRIYSRAKYAKLGWDDGIMLFALVGRVMERERIPVENADLALGSGFACDRSDLGRNKSWSGTTSILFEPMGASAAIKVQHPQSNLLHHEPLFL